MVTHFFISLALPLFIPLSRFAGKQAGTLTGYKKTAMNFLTQIHILSTFSKNPCSHKLDVKGGRSMTSTGEQSIPRKGLENERT